MRIFAKHFADRFHFLQKSKPPAPCATIQAPCTGAMDNRGALA
jgi:hypothetical protein